MGSDKYFKLSDINMGPKDIAAVAKQKFERKMVRGANSDLIDGASEMTEQEQLQLWGEYEKEYGQQAQA